MISISYEAQSHSKELARDWSFLTQIEVTEVDDSCRGYGIYMIHFTYKSQPYKLILSHTDNSEVVHEEGEDVPFELRPMGCAVQWEDGESTLYVLMRGGDYLIFKNIKWQNAEEEEL